MCLEQGKNGLNLTKVWLERNAGTFFFEWICSKYDTIFGNEKKIVSFSLSNLIVSMFLLLFLIFNLVISHFFSKREKKYACNLISFLFRWIITHDFCLKINKKKRREIMLRGLIVLIDERKEMSFISIILSCSTIEVDLLNYARTVFRMLLTD